MKRSLTILLGVLLVLAVAAGAFYGGMVYGKGQAQASFPGPRGEGAAFFGQGPAGAAASGQAGTFTRRQGGMVFGEIQSIRGGDLTIKDESGKQIVVHVTDTTLIQKQADVTLAELQEGETAIVSGTTGADGSITARSLQVSPAGAAGFGMPRIDVVGTPGAPGEGQP